MSTKSSQNPLILAALVVASLSSVGIATDAFACSGLFACRNTILVGEKLPSGAGGFFWFIAGGGIARTDIPDEALTLEHKIGEEWIAEEWEITSSHPGGTYHIVRPSDGFVVGDDYKLSASLEGWTTVCDPDINAGYATAEVDATTQVVAVAPGAKLSTSVTEQSHGLLEFAQEASCSDRVDSVWRDLTIELPPELEGMDDSLFFSVTVDGEDYFHEYDALFFQDVLPGALDQSRRTTRLAATCVETPDYLASSALSQGSHTVVVSAQLPDSDIFKWTSDPVMIDLTCPDEEEQEEPNMESPDDEEMKGEGPDLEEEGEAPTSEDSEEDEGCASTRPTAPAPEPLALLSLLVFFGAILQRVRRQVD